jgi:hypothetical protein
VSIAPSGVITLVYVQASPEGAVRLNAILAAANAVQACSAETVSRLVLVFPCNDLLLFPWQWQPTSDKPTISAVLVHRSAVCSTPGRSETKNCYSSFVLGT